MNLFKVTWKSYGELDNTSTDFCEITYDISSHRIFYETCNSIKHTLCCDFGSIFDKLHYIVESDEFQNEKPYKDGCEGDWYKFEYTLNGKEVQYEVYIYGLKGHEEIISLIESCSKNTLKDEKKLLQYKYIDIDGSHFGIVEDWVLDIINSRKKLEEDFFDFWKDIIIVQIPDGFIKCDKCNSIIHNKYYKIENIGVENG